MAETRLDLLHALVKKRPKDSFAQYGLAMEYRRLGSLARAKETFSGLLEIDPDYTAAYLQFALTLQDLGEIEAAVGTVEKGISAAERSGDVRAQGELNGLLEELRDFDPTEGAT